eukprot:692647-Rhodomonas_salina.1
MHAASSWEGSSFKLYFDEETEAHRVAICGHNRKRRFCNLCAEKSVLCPHNRRRPLCAVCDDCWSSKPPQANSAVLRERHAMFGADMACGATRLEAASPLKMRRESAVTCRMRSAKLQVSSAFWLRTRYARPSSDAAYGPTRGSCKPADLSRQLTEEGKESEGEGKGGAGGSETESKNASAVRSEKNTERSLIYTKSSFRKASGIVLKVVSSRIRGLEHDMLTADPDANS